MDWNYVAIILSAGFIGSFLGSVSAYYYTRRLQRGYFLTRAEALVMARQIDDLGRVMQASYEDDLHRMMKPE